MPSAADVGKWVRNHNPAVELAGVQVLGEDALAAVAFRRRHNGRIPEGIYKTNILS